MDHSVHPDLFPRVEFDTRGQCDGHAGRGSASHVTDHARHAGIVLTVLLIVLALVWLWTSDASQMGVNILAIIWVCYAPLLGYTLVGGE